jgi:DNA-binding XRE family transcriptional regulator
LTAWYAKNKKSRTLKTITIMPKQTKQVPNRIYAHRRKASLTQRELAMLIGYGDEGSVAHHERFTSLPPFLIALAYEIIFQVPVSELFFGLRDTVEHVVEERISDLKKSLGERDARGRFATRDARKLEWLTNRQA